jgi:hypothetical protein
MATRVLATPGAAGASGRIESILYSGLTETIQSLNHFRGNVWNAHTQLQKLHRRLKSIYAQIMQAGGNAPT